MPHKTLKTGIPITEVAKIVGGSAMGNLKQLVFGLCSVDEPIAEHLCFLRVKSQTHALKVIESSGLKAFLITEDIADIAIKPDVAFVVVKDPQRALMSCIPHFFEPYRQATGISPKAEVDSSAIIGKGVSIGAFCVIGPLARIGDDTTLHPHVIIYPGAQIGARTVIHSNAVVREDCKIGSDSVIQNGAVIGGDGFGYIADPTSGLLAVPQVGNVSLADRVDVGANACIDRAALGSTAVGLGTKIDNLVQIGHNTKIGRFSILCGLSGVSGSCNLGDQVVLGGNAGIADHISIADGVRFSAKSGVTGDILEKGDYAVHPAIPARQWKRNAALMRDLPKLISELKAEKKEKA